MNYGYTKPEVEKPKPTKKELRTMMHIEARSHANTLDDLAAGYRLVHGGSYMSMTLPDAMEKAAKFLRELTK